jgi:D-alanine-D-alanine ligase
MSAESVLNALDPERYDITPIGISRDGRWLTGPNVLQALRKGDLSGLKPVALLPVPEESGTVTFQEVSERRGLTPLATVDVIFPVLHGTFGEDGTLQGLLEMAEAAYVGAGVLASSVAMDKGLFKDVMIARGLPVVESILVSRSEIQADSQDVIRQAQALAPYPLFVKPANMGSSVGVTKATGPSDLYEGLMEAAQFDRRILIERGLDAREIEVSVLGNDRPEASVVGEIKPFGDFYTYESKYHEDRSELLIPAPISDALADQVRRTAVQAYTAIDGAGLARVDFLLEHETNQLYLNEINTIPGFTQISMYSKLWEAAGLPYSNLVDRLVDLALERSAERAGTIREYKR